MDGIVNCASCIVHRAWCIVHEARKPTACQDPFSATGLKQWA
jgi:hypothetical protein